MAEQENFSITIERLGELEAAYFNDACHSPRTSYHSLSPDELYTYDIMRQESDGNLEKWWGHITSLGEAEWMHNAKMNDQARKMRGEIK